MSSFFLPDFPPPLVDRTDDSNRQSPTSLGGSGFLPPPPSSSMLNHTDVISPSLHNINTPAESVLSIHYQSSDFSEFEPGDDSYFNADFSTLGGNGPSFLGDTTLGDFSLFPADGPAAAAVSYTTPEPLFHNPKTYLISPDQTPSLNTNSPQYRAALAQRSLPDNLVSAEALLSVGLISPQQLAIAPPAADLPQFDGFVFEGAAQLTPDTTSSGDSLGITSMAGQNPHVTVSHWSNSAVASGLEQTFGIGIDDDEDMPVSPSAPPSVIRDTQGNWVANPATGLGGIDPSGRTTAEATASINEAAEARKVQEQNGVVSQWLDASDIAPDVEQPSAQPLEPAFEGVSTRGVGLGDETVNVEQPGQIYYAEGGGGPLVEGDYQIMLDSHIWDDRPMRLPIFQGARRQPESSQAAMAKFERMCQDNSSMLSRVATWGTRRRSLPNVADIEGITSGNFLKKLSLSRGDTRRPSILEGLRTLVRMPSTNQQMKRSRSNQDEETATNVDAGWGDLPAEEERRDSNTLAPPSRTPSTNKGNRQQMPSINTALVSMGSSVASIGTTHARSGSVSRPHAGSVSLSPPLTSPKSPLLKVSNSLRRPRSKSDLSRATPQNPHPNLVRMLKATGGPPVANAFAQPSAPFVAVGPPQPAPIRIPSKVAVPDPDDEDDDEDEGLEDGDEKSGSDELINNISPDLEGFRELVLGLNPMLAESNTYLVERIAYQQIQRYKSLLNSKVRHLGHVKGRSCANGERCIELGGVAILLEGKKDSLTQDMLYDGSDMGDLTSPLDGAITIESFPKHIPMPPTTSLPAEFECQLCFQNKRFQKPSDWTKHVHEDVQPFTCTWDRCRDPKIFKRKADWVRHENEGHRHLEWWTCDVEECRHTCYRRDNFLQHLVREHKFLEPKHKTKAAIKKAGASDPTWQRVEQCHRETKVRPQDEPCKFCGKTFPTWKKLTVHLAKHMEYISLPILKLVDRKELDADTIISPVQDPPPRTFAPPTTFPGAGETPRGLMMGLSPNLGVMAEPFRGQPGPTVAYVPADTPDPNAYAFSPVPPVQFHRPYYGQPHPFVGSTGMPSPMQGLDLTSLESTAGPSRFVSAVPYGHNHLPATTASYLAPTTTHFLADTSSIDAVSYSGLPVTTDALGLQASLTGAQMGYDSVVETSDDKQFVPQGSIPSYNSSPYQGQGQFYAQ